MVRPSAKTSCLCLRVYHGYEAHRGEEQHCGGLPLSRCHQCRTPGCRPTSSLTQRSRPTEQLSPTYSWQKFSSTVQAPHCCVTSPPADPDPLCPTAGEGRIFDAIHSLSHPGRKPMQRLVAAKPLPPSRRSTHLLTVIDRTTRWPEAIPLTSTTTVDIVRVFFGTWVAHFGYTSLFFKYRHYSIYAPR